MFFWERNLCHGDHCIEISGRHNLCPVCCDVELVDECADVRIQSGLTIFVQGYERLVGRSVIGAEDVHEMIGRLVAEVEVALMECDV